MVAVQRGRSVSTINTSTHDNENTSAATLAASFPTFRQRVELDIPHALAPPTSPYLAYPTTSSLPRPRAHTYAEQGKFGIAVKLKFKALQTRPASTWT